MSLRRLFPKKKESRKEFEKKEQNGFMEYAKIVPRNASFQPKNAEKDSSPDIMARRMKKIGESNRHIINYSFTPPYIARHNYNCLRLMKAQYKIVSLGKLPTGAPMQWYILDEIEGKKLLLNESAYLFCGENNLQTSLREVEQWLTDEKIYIEPSSLFIPNRKMVENYLSGHFELLCKGARNKVDHHPNFNPAWNHDSNYVPWFLSDRSDSSIEERRIYFPSTKSAGVYGNEDGDIIIGNHWCVSDYGDMMISISHTYRDNLGGGGYYQEYYGIRPAFWISKGQIHVEN